VTSDDNGTVKLSLSDWAKFLATHLISFIVLVAVMWNRLALLQADMEYNKKAMEMNRNAIQSLSDDMKELVTKRFVDHLSDPVIHRGGITALESRTTTLEKRVDRLEAQP